MTENKNTPKGNENAVSLKELWKNFDEIRKFEISNLWQRSIFLGAFLIAGIVAYSTTVQGLWDEGTNPDKTTLIHFVCEAIAGINLLFSILWIMMAKGSKAWQEIYEAYRCEIEHQPELGIPEQYCHGYKQFGHAYDVRKENYIENESIDYSNALDSCLFTQNGGDFSPSKINILIGQIFGVIWFLLLILHLTLAIFPCNINWKRIAPIAIFIIVFVGVWWSFRRSKSSHLKHNKNQRD